MSNPYAWPPDNENDWIILKCLWKLREFRENQGYETLVLALLQACEAIRAHPVYFEAQLQTESKPDDFLAFSTAISYHFHISFELQLDKTKAKR